MNLKWVSGEKMVRQQHLRAKETSNESSHTADRVMNDWHHPYKRKTRGRTIGPYIVERRYLDSKIA